MRQQRIADEHPLVLALVLNLTFVAVGCVATLALRALEPAGEWASMDGLLFGDWVALGAREWAVLGVLAFSMPIGSVAAAVAYQSGPLLFTAFLPQFAVPGEPFAPQLAALGALYIAVEFVAACGYAALGASVRRIEITPFRARLIDRTTGVMMLGAAALLATTKRSGRSGRRGG